MADDIATEDQMAALKQKLAEQVQEFAEAVAEIYGDATPLVKDFVLITGSVRFVDGDRLSVCEFQGDHEQDDWVTKGLIVEALDQMRYLQFSEMEADDLEDEDD